jgi:hypothetical protein
MPTRSKVLGDGTICGEETLRVARGFKGFVANFVVVKYMGDTFLDLSYEKREYCLSNDILLCFPIVFVVTGTIGGKHEHLSEMHASARGQGRESQGHTALALSGLWLSIYAHHATWETRVAEIAGRIPLLSRPLHQCIGEDVRRSCELCVEMDPAVRRRSR